MNYYIITLRDNLDNILSSESISPAAFYSNRGYGYRTFSLSRMCKSEFVLTLYKEAVDTEEDVVYIELSGGDEQLKNLSHDNLDDAYTTSKTIWLYPWNCKILFKSLEAAKDSFFLCRSSLSNKMWNCYQFGLIGKANSENRSIYAAEPLAREFARDVEEDRQRNQIKGFLFSYNLGLMKSLSPELAKLLQAEMKIYGMATVLAGMQKSNEDIVKKLNAFRTVFNSVDPNRSKLKQLWQEQILGSFSSEKDQKVFEAVLSRYGVQRTVMDSFAREQSVPLSPRIDPAYASNRDWTQYKTMLERYTKDLLRQYIENNVASADEVVKLDDNYVKVGADIDDLYEQLINYILAGHDFLSIDRVRSKKLDAATEAAKYLKDYYEFSGRQWDGSHEQAYMNNLRQNIAYSSSFDPNETANKALRALAIYILKGDTIDDLLKYIQYMGVEDYSLTFGLWGANVGYTDMPKTFLNLIDLPSEKVLECYMNMYVSISGENTDYSLNPNSYEEVLKSEKQIVHSKVNRPSASIDVATMLMSPTLKLSHVQIQEVESIVNKNNGQIDEEGFKLIGKIKGIGKKKLDQIKLLLAPLYHSQSLFKEDKIQNGQINESAWDVVQDSLPADEKVRSQVKRDLTWFIDKNYHQMDKAELIIKLCDYLSRNKHATGNRAWLRGLYKDVEVPVIETKLRETFL